MTSLYLGYRGRGARKGTIQVAELAPRIKVCEGVEHVVTPADVSTNAPGIEAQEDRYFHE